jgi:hypothetical protein
MQPAALDTDVRVTSMRKTRAATGAARLSLRALDEGSQPGADKHTAGGRRVMLAARGALGCGWLSERVLVPAVEAAGAAFWAQDGWVVGVPGGLRGS